MPNNHIQHEANEQEALFRWAAFVRGRFPEIDLLYHIPNGGSRNRLEAANLKRQGVKAGVPDLCLPVASGKYHGLYIELKYGKNKPSEIKNNGYPIFGSKVTRPKSVTAGSRRPK